MSCKSGHLKKVKVNLSRNLIFHIHGGLHSEAPSISMHNLVPCQNQNPYWGKMQEELTQYHLLDFAAYNSWKC